MMISVIICCYNSSSRLEVTLCHLLRQERVDSASMEIIVVDNNSTDNTSQVAASGLRDAKFPWKIIVEKKQGLTAAREAGVASARGELILFCDDDNWLECDYLWTAREFMINNPRFGAVTGCGVAVTDGNLPEWFSLVAGMYACDSEAKDDFGRHCLPGAALVIRKSCLDRIKFVGVEFALTDRSGSALSSGGDGEITILIRMGGWRLGKMKNMRFSHYMPRQRLDVSYAVNLTKGIGSALPVFSLYEILFRGIPCTRTIWCLPLINLYLFFRWLGVFCANYFKRGFISKMRRYRASAVLRQMFSFGVIRAQYRAYRNVILVLGDRVSDGD